jgi:hypothetical protein
MESLVTHHPRAAPSAPLRIYDLNRPTNEEWRGADFWAWVASAHRGGSNPFDEEPQAEYCWCVRSRDGKLVKFDNKSVLQARVKGYQTAALFPAVREAFACIPNGSHVHVFSNVKFFTDILNEEPSRRMKSGYLRTDKEPLAHQEEWKALDTTRTERSQRVSAGPPPKWEVAGSLEWRIAFTFKDVAEGASKAARNIGIRFRDWDT